jgi:hypothetical protein
MIPRKLTDLKSIVFCCAGIPIGLLGVVILFKDLILTVIRTGTLGVLWANDFDPRLIYWIVNWGYHVLFEEGQPLSFWNANSFYPNNMTLAYSDSLLSAQLLYAPLRMVGVPALASLYITLAGICLIGVTLTQCALDRTGYFSFVERVLIAFSAHFGLSVSGFLFHYQLFGFHLALPFFLFLYLYLRDLKRTDLLVTLFLFNVGVSFAMYLAPMLLALSIPMSIPLVAKQIKRLGANRLLQSIGIREVCIVASCTLVLYFVQVRPYIAVAQAFPKQWSFEETVIYSADLASIFTGFSKFSFWYGPEEYPSYGAWEYAYFPGFVLLSLSLLYWGFLSGVIVKRRIFALGQSRHSDQFQWKWFKGSKEIKYEFILYMTILFVSSIILSWGPFYKPNYSVRLPFYYLSHVVFGLDDIRAPGRFGMFIGLPLATFSVAFFRLAVNSREKRKLISLLVLLLIIVESFPSFPTFPFTIDEKGIYKRVSEEIQPGTPLIELPVSGKDHFETVKIAMEQLNGSTIHWGRLVVGYGSKTTSQYNDLVHLDSLIQQDLVDPREAIEFGARYNISCFLIHLNRYNSPVNEKWKRIFSEVGWSVLFENEDILFVKRTE